MAAERWVLISNCQSYGLAHSLQMLAADVTVEPVDAGQFAQDVGGYNRRFGEYDRVLAGRSALDVAGADFSRARRVDEVPELSFAAYHPDMTYVMEGPKHLQGPLDAYHSMIAFCAHREGATTAEALRLFDRRVYALCGYLDGWTAARDHVVSYCASLRLDVSQAIRRWGREGAFMYSSNHPRIRVLYDLARLYLEREGYAPQVSDALPHDNLASGSVFAVYPEIGEALGVPGAYLFKRAFAYSQIDLRRFVEECFAVYDAHPPGALTTHAVFEAQHARVSAVVSEAWRAR